MSKYLIRRIEETENIFLHVHCKITELSGAGHLERIKYYCGSDDTEHELECASLFTMVGAVPNTGWLSGCVALDEKGFVRTGRDLTEQDLSGWKLSRTPYLYETSKPRVFAVGDVRSDSTKRVATAVGEGSAAIMFMHRALADLD
jgi:thioredoxin reductase (NADPH)